MRLVALATRIGAAVSKIVIGGLLLGAIGVMLAGVFLRYVAAPIATALDVQPINFFWVQETGELLMIWIAMLGAAVAVFVRAHFALDVFAHRLRPALQSIFHLGACGVEMFFALTLAWEGWKLAQINAGLDSPALGISLKWVYLAPVAGGLLIALAALAFAITLITGHHDVELDNWH
jgi:TRAP-type C4-dicarboxylate transport system permease small subunit